MNCLADSTFFCKQETFKEDTHVYYIINSWHSFPDGERHTYVQIILGHYVPTFSCLDV